VNDKLSGNKFFSNKHVLVMFGNTIKGDVKIAAPSNMASPHFTMLFTELRSAGKTREAACAVDL
jgi:hypothetical protein